MGAKEDHCLEAVRRLSEDDRVRDPQVSDLYLTSPVGPVDQDDFVNCVLRFTWSSGPLELLAFLQAVEGAMGRSRLLPMGPRIIDLDILLYGSLIMDSTILTVPHPELHRRRFAIVPVLDLDPHIIHPRFEKPLASFLHLVDPLQKAAPLQPKRMKGVHGENPLH